MGRLGVGLATAAVWALAAGSLFAWLLPGAPESASVAPAYAATGAIDVDGARVAQALGAVGAQAAPLARSDELARLKLLGVLTHGAQGAVLVAVAGQPPRPVRVGAPIPGLSADWRLKSVSPHAAVFVRDGRATTLEMPALDARSRAGDVVAIVQAPLPVAADPAAAAQRALLAQRARAAAPAAGQ